MIHMEVDLRSPSFRALRPLSSSKRARSPESLPERPAKRPSLSIDHARPGRFTHTSSSGNATPQSPASSSSRFPSEDWVHQADELSIDSPVVPGSGLAEDRDEDMNMDPDEPIAEEHTQRPAPLPTMSFAQTAVYHQQHLRHREHIPLSATSAPTPSDPPTAVLPPAPLSTSYIDPRGTRPSTPVSAGGDSSAMLPSSPTTSFSVVNVTSPRKQRFTMGPRSDCIKCQLGVKGHSVHY